MENSHQLSEGVSLSASPVLLIVDKMQLNWIVNFIYFYITFTEEVTRSREVYYLLKTYI